MDKRLTRSEEAALNAYPPTYTTGKRYAKRVQSELVDTHRPVRAIFQQGYEQAEQDLALTWEDVSILITIYEAGIENGDYRRHNEAEWMKEYSQDILRKFNEIRKK